MKSLNADTRLTDTLERELLTRALHDQVALAQGQAVKAFFKELFAKLTRKEQRTPTDTVQTAN